MKKWTRWQNWVVVAAGLYAALSTIWTTHTGASLALMLILGVLLIIAGVWDLVVPRLVSMEWIEALLGALLFISPWAGMYATQSGGTGAAWTSWICGAVALIAGLWAVVPAMRMHQQEVHA